MLVYLALAVAIVGEVTATVSRGLVLVIAGVVAIEVGSGAGA
ncbi:hypothetical protein ACRAKI_35580 [Saccharothrix isguenensis]